MTSRSFLIHNMKKKNGVTLAVGLALHGAGRRVDLGLVARHALVHVDVEVLLDDVHDDALALVLQEALQARVRVARHAHRELARPERQQNKLSGQRLIADVPPRLQH